MACARRAAPCRFRFTQNRATDRCNSDSVPSDFATLMSMRLTGRPAAAVRAGPSVRLEPAAHDSFNRGIEYGDARRLAGSNHKTAAARVARACRMATRESQRREPRTEEHPSELQTLMRISYADFFL